MNLPKTTHELVKTPQNHQNHQNHPKPLKTPQNHQNHQDPQNHPKPPETHQNPSKAKNHKKPPKPKPSKTTQINRTTCSMEIRDLTTEDGGTYNCLRTSHNGLSRHSAHAHIVVYHIPKCTFSYTMINCSN